MPTLLGTTPAVSAIVPSLDGPVLVTLAGLDAPASGRRIHQLCGAGSEAGVRKVLTRLVGHGLVRASPIGGAVLYAANRDHLAWPVVTALAALPDALVARLRAQLGGWTTRPRAAALLGAADGGYPEVLLVRRRRTDDADRAWQAQVERLRHDLLAWTGVAGRIHDLGPAELAARAAKRDPVLAEWRRTAITVAGKDVRDLFDGGGKRNR